MAIEATVTPLPLLRKERNLLLQCIEILVSVQQVLQDTHVVLTLESGETFDLGPLSAKTQRFSVFLPEAAAHQTELLLLSYGNQSFGCNVRRGPVRRWTVHLVLHSHTDLGFTDAVSDVAEIHNNNTDLAIQYCRETEGWEPGSNFRWTCEVSWQVENYLRDRNASKAQTLMELARRRAIEVGALYAGEHTDILGHEEAIRSLYYAAHLRNAYRIPVDTVLLSDVPGCTQGFVQIMAKAGITHFILADNNFLAPFLTRTDLPRPFLWEGSDDTFVLCWFTDHPYYAYVEGEFYGFAESVEAVLRKLPPKLLELEREGYPFDRFQIQYAFDNAPITFLPAEIVRAWNRQWAFPRLQLSTARECLSALHARHGSSLPRRRGDWTSWWGSIASGFPHEASLARRLHDALPTQELLHTLVSIAKPPVSYPAERITRAYHDVLAFDEHSGGGGVWRPKSREQQQKALREGYGFLESARQCVDELSEIALGHLGSLVAGTRGEKSVGVFNPLGWPRSGWVTDPGGDGSRFFVCDVPPFGYAVLGGDEVAAGRGRQGVPVRGAREWCVLENEQYRVTINRAAGTVDAVYDKLLGEEVTHPEEPDSGSPLFYVAEPPDRIELGKYIPKIYDGTEAPGGFIRPPLGSEVVCEEWGGDFSTACRLRYLFGGEEWLMREILLERETRAVQFRTVVRHALLTNASLEAVRRPHALLYFGFAFAMDRPRIQYESPGMVLEPAHNQLEGTCMDFYAVQHWIRLFNDAANVVLCSPDAPLVDIGSPGLYRFKRHLGENTSRLFVRAVSLDAWEGEHASPYSKGRDLEFRFALASYARQADQAADIVPAHRLGWEMQQPLLSFVPHDGSEGAHSGSRGSFLTVEAPNVHVLTLKKAEEGDDIVLRLQEIAGADASVFIRFPRCEIVAARNAMLTEEPLEEIPVCEGGLKIVLRPLSITTVRLRVRADVHANRE